MPGWRYATVSCEGLIATPLTPLIATNSWIVCGMNWPPDGGAERASARTLVIRMTAVPLPGGVNGTPVHTMDVHPLVPAALVCIFWSCPWNALYPLAGFVQSVFAGQTLIAGVPDPVGSFSSNRASLNPLDVSLLVTNEFKKICTLIVPGVAAPVQFSTTSPTSSATPSERMTGGTPAEALHV